ncbi:hypothetical protein RLOC_00008208 [Lonchura striata]|uniref:Uncharacterized protein n=1 Tax=Lonchura striata TaxID=40157 RepID=A0A218UDJ1_9PASE|nr:hypothetical protein RLOC_00008208 [Lonchura striata domestica]
MPDCGARRTSSSLCNTGVFNKASVQLGCCFAWAEEGQQLVFGSRALLPGPSRSSVVVMVSEHRVCSFTSVFYFLYTQTTDVLSHSTINTIHINHSVRREKKAQSSPWLEQCVVMASSSSWLLEPLSLKAFSLTESRI